MTCVVVVCTGGGGGGGAACVVVVCTGGGGGGAACVVLVAAGVVLGAVGTAVTRALCNACWPCSCCLALCLCLGFGFTVVVAVVAGVDWVVEVLAGAAALLLEVDEEAPQALTINTSRTAANAMRRCVMA